MKVCLKLIIVTLILMISVMSCSSKEDKKQSHFNKGTQYFEAQEYKKAEIEFKNALQIDSRYVDALLKLGDTLMKLGQGNEAFSAYSQAESISPDNVQAMINLAKFYFFNKNQEEAKSRIEKVLEQDQNHIDALYLKAQMLISQKEFAAAASLYEKILELKNDHIPSLQGLALLKSFQKEFDQAETLLLRAVDGASNTTQPRLALFSYYISQKDLLKAEEQLKLLAAENPGNADPQIVLGNFYLSTQKTGPAEDAYKKAVEISPDQVKPYLSLAGYYDSMNQKEKVLEVLEKAVKIDSEEMAARQTLARFHYKHKNIEAAEKLVTEILEQRPNFVPIKMLQSEILIFNKEFEKALLMLGQLEADEPNASRVHYFKGLCHVGLGNIVMATTSVSKALELKPDDIKARLLLADLYFSQQDFGLAVKLASEVLDQNDSLYQALMIRANSQLSLGKFKEAEEDYNKMMEIDQDNPAGSYRLAYLKSELKQYEEAEDLLEKSHSLNNQLIDVFTLRVRISMAQKQFEKAHDLCRQQLETARDNKQIQAFVHNIQAGVFLAEQKVGEAKTSYEKAIETDPDYLMSYNALAGIYLAQKDLNNAIGQYTTILDKNPNLAPPHMMLATIYEAEKEYGKAETHYRKALEIHPEFAAAANNLAYHLAERTDKFDEALKYAKQAKEHFPEDPGVMDTLGFAYYQKGLYGNAVSELLDSLKKIPDNPIVRYHLGLAYHKKGDMDLARKELSRALEISREFPGAETAKTLLEELNKGGG